VRQISDYWGLNMTHRILVVEDEPSIAELIAINLTHAGFEVEKAMQTDVALNMMRDELPNLLILDWMLPGKSGVQFAKELRANERTRFLPILMLTAKSEESDKVLGLDSGADDYVTKPFSPKELVARVKALLRRQTPVEETGPLSVGPLQLDPVSHRVLAVWPNMEPKPIPLGLLNTGFCNFSWQIQSVCIPALIFWIRSGAMRSTLKSALLTSISRG